VRNRLAWDHNAYYQRLLLREARAGTRRVLDVGCGAGALAVRLAGRVERVDAIDVSAGMIEAARERAPGNVRCVLGDVMEYPLPEAEYDLIVSLTALHHLPLEAALGRLARALRPGGTLAVVALPRMDLPRELPIELLAVTGQRVLGVGFAALRRFRLEETHGEMPKCFEPELTTAGVRAVAARVLPGSRVRRLVYWRYLLRWRRPEA
jgi:ubiquinone/menaquinone biosynthesis C-methylase UbiE